MVCGIIGEKASKYNNLIAKLKFAITSGCVREFQRPHDLHTLNKLGPDSVIPVWIENVTKNKGANMDMDISVLHFSSLNKWDFE